MSSTQILDVLEKVKEIAIIYLYEKTILWLIVIALLLLYSMKVAVGVLVRSRKREWDSVYFKWFTLSLFIWTALSAIPYALPYLPFFQQHTQLLWDIYNYRVVAMLFASPLLCLHIWTQVSYRDITWRTWLLYFSAPLALSVISVRDIILNETGPGYVLWVDEGVGKILFFLFFSAILAKSYLLMFNVFYQMPPHMRRSTKHMLVGTTYILVAVAVQMLFLNLPPFDFTMLAMCFALGYMFNAFSIDSSANVIATSRDFVFSNLSTMVIILSKRKNILDWNRKTDAHKLLLPTPQFREPFAHYYQRILEEGNGKVSDHDQNIITTTRENADGHYLITTHEVRQKRKQFGYLVEISEVTKIYTVFRYLEEIAIKDQLTGLYNRNAYIHMVQKLVSEEHMPLLILVGDVDNLKPINDTFGHLRGDSLLLAAAKAIRAHAPAEAFIARVGGDEFVLLMAGGNEEMAQTFIEKVNLENTFMLKEQEMELSISWGYSIMWSASEDYNQVFEGADAMMYATKKGRSRFTSSGSVPEKMAAGIGEKEENSLPGSEGEDFPDSEPTAVDAGEGKLFGEPRHGKTELEGPEQATEQEKAQKLEQEKELLDIIDRILP